MPVLGGLQSIWQGLGIPVTVTAPLEPEQEAVLWYIRMPRILVGLMVGASLALAGAVMQGIFSNPLADPGIMGVSAGASLGAVIAISLGLTSLGMFYMPMFAFIGAFAAVSIYDFINHAWWSCGNGYFIIGLGLLSVCCLVLLPPVF